MFSGHLLGFHQLKLFGARRRLIWEILLSPWMTGSKRIKYNFESSRNPRLSHLSFDAYSASILLLASTKCPYFSRKSMPFCVWTAIWSYWSWNWFILVEFMELLSHYSIEHKFIALVSNHHPFRGKLQQECGLRWTHSTFNNSNTSKYHITAYQSKTGKQSFVGSQQYAANFQFLQL